MNIVKRDLARIIAEKNGQISIKDAENIIENLTDAIIEAVAKGDNVRIFGFGTFLRRVRPGRTTRNPMTGKIVECPERNVVGFRPVQAFADALNPSE